jgi:hypothetical protein
VVPADHYPDSSRSHLPEVVQLGSGIVLFFDDPVDPRMRGIVITVARLQDRFPHLYAEVEVEQDEKNIEWGVIDLLSARARADMTTRLSEKGKWPGMSRTWATILDQTAEEVLNNRRAESDFEVLDGEVISGPPRPILEPVLPDQVPTLIYGQGGSFKSTLLTAILVSVASGVEVIRGWKPRQAAVLYLDWESSRQVVDARRRAISRGMGVEPPRFHYRRMAGPLSACVDELGEVIAESGIGCIGVDSVGMALGSGSGGDSNESTLELFAALRRFPVAWVLIDHVTGDDMRAATSVPKPYGSVYKFNLARAAYELRAQAEPEPPRTQLLLRQSKSEEMQPRLGPIGLAVVHESDSIRFELAEITAPDLLSTSPGTNADRIEDLLRLGARFPAEISDRLGLKADVVRSKLHSQNKKRFVQLSDGRWGLAQRG